MLRHDDLDPRSTALIPVTYAEWLAWAGESHQTEWEDGRAIRSRRRSAMRQPRTAVATMLGSYRFDPAWFGEESPDLRAALRAVMPERFGG